MISQADRAERYGLRTVPHFAGSPIAFTANLHCAAAVPSFVALEHHGLDIPFCREPVTGLPERYMEGDSRWRRTPRAWGRTWTFL